MAQYQSLRAHKCATTVTQHNGTTMGMKVDDSSVFRNIWICITVLSNWSLLRLVYVSRLFQSEDQSVFVIKKGNQTMRAKMTDTACSISWCKSVPLLSTHLLMCGLWCYWGFFVAVPHKAWMFHDQTVILEEFEYFVCLQRQPCVTVQVDQCDVRWLHSCVCVWVCVELPQAAQLSVGGTIILILGLRPLVSERALREGCQVCEENLFKLSKTQPKGLFFCFGHAGCLFLFWIYTGNI